MKVAMFEEYVLVTKIEDFGLLNPVLTAKPPTSLTDSMQIVSRILANSIPSQPSHSEQLAYASIFFVMLFIFSIQL